MFGWRLAPKSSVFTIIDPLDISIKQNLRYFTRASPPYKTLLPSVQSASSCTNYVIKKIYKITVPPPHALLVCARFIWIPYLVIITHVRDVWSSSLMTRHSSHAVLQPLKCFLGFMHSYHRYSRTTRHSCTFKGEGTVKEKLEKTVM